MHNMQFQIIKFSINGMFTWGMKVKLQNLIYFEISFLIEKCHLAIIIIHLDSRDQIICLCAKDVSIWCNEANVITLFEILSIRRFTFCRSWDINGSLPFSLYIKLRIFIKIYDCACAFSPISSLFTIVCYSW